MRNVRRLDDQHDSAGRSVLSHAEFFGRPDHRVEVSGFTLALMDADPVHDVARHTHETAHWIHCLRGPYISSARGAPALSVTPTLIYNPPGTTHRDRFQNTSGRFEGRFLSIALSAERLADISNDVRLEEEAIRVFAPEALILTARLAAECARWDEASPLVAEGLCLELMEKAARRQSREERSWPQWLRIATDQIRDRCAETLTVGDIALSAGVHPVHLARTFRRFVGCSPGDYLRLCRVVRGVELLVGTRQSLSEVALASGFVDQSHFSRLLRRSFGSTPAEYRRVVMGRSA